MSGKFTVFAIESIRTDTMVTTLLRGADASILTRRIGAKVHLILAVSAHVAGFTVAVVVVDQLNAVQCASIRARIRQTLIDVTFATRTHKSRRAGTFKTAHAIDTSAIVVARTRLTIVLIEFTNNAQSTGRTGTAEGLNEIVAGASILTGIRRAVINV